MSQENVETVKRAIAAVNDRDVDGYLACCTEDVQMRTPLASIGAVYEGADAIRRFFVDIQDTVPDFRVELERLDAMNTAGSSPWCELPQPGELAASPPPAICQLQTSMNSPTARSGASESSSTA